MWKAKLTMESKGGKARFVYGVKSDFWPTLVGGAFVRLRVKEGWW